MIFFIEKDFYLYLNEWESEAITMKERSQKLKFLLNQFIDGAYIEGPN